MQFARLAWTGEQATAACPRSTALPTMSRVSRIAPVSREMMLSLVAQHDLQLPRSY